MSEPTGRTGQPRTEAVVGAADGAGRVLLVEDDAVLREATGMALERYGFQVRTAADGMTGLELFLGEPPDVVAIGNNDTGSGSIWGVYYGAGAIGGSPFGVIDLGDAITKAMAEWDFQPWVDTMQMVRRWNEAGYYGAEPWPAADFAVGYPRRRMPGKLPPPNAMGLHRGTRCVGSLHARCQPSQAPPASIARAQILRRNDCEGSGRATGDFLFTSTGG